MRNIKLLEHLCQSETIIIVKQRHEPTPGISCISSTMLWKILEKIYLKSNLHLLRQVGSLYTFDMYQSASIKPKRSILSFVASSQNVLVRASLFAHESCISLTVYNKKQHMRLGVKHLQRNHLTKREWILKKQNT